MMHKDELLEEAKAFWDKGDMQSAMDAYKKILRRKPNHLDANYMLGTLYGETGDFSSALKLLKYAARLDSSSPYIQNNMGIIHQKTGDLATASACYKRALALKKDFANANYNLATALIGEAKTDEALVYYQNALSSEPDFTPAKSGIASVYEMRGDYDTAMEMIKPLLKSTHPDAILLSTYSNICAHSNASWWTRRKAIWALKKTLFNTTEFNKFNYLDKMALFFSLAQLYDKIGKYKKAFDYYSAGNSWYRYKYDHESTELRCSAIKNKYTKSYIEEMPCNQESEISPIFIVSMPRSGSTLIESILAAHSQVGAMGETDSLDNILGNIYKKPGTCGLKDSKLKNLSHQYAQLIPKELLQKERVTDKSIGNFWHIGEILQLFPNSRIIHVQRDPIATCFSCFTHNFSGNLPYTYNLNDLGTYYQSYLEITQHWENVCADKVLTVKYEALVENPENIVKQLLQFCDLPWQDPCLEFYNSKRIVATSSYHQVQKPIYKTAKKHYTHYLPYLKALVDTLNEE